MPRAIDCWRLPDLSKNHEKPQGTGAIAMRRILFGAVAALGLAFVPAAVKADDWHGHGRGHSSHGHGGHGHYDRHRDHHHHYLHRPSYGYSRAPVYRVQPYPYYGYGYGQRSYYSPPRSGFYYRDNDFSIGIGF